MILASTSFEDLVSRVDVVHSLVGGDNQLVGRLQAARDDVRREKREIAAKESEVHKAVAELAGAERAARGAARRARPRSRARRWRRARTRPARSRTSTTTWLSSPARRTSSSPRATPSRASSTARPGGGGGTGSLAWPVSGPVTSPFGWRVHPILHVRKFHTGIDIGVGYGTPIHAADSGTVIYATWMSGYGNVIIIDHGGGISTLYAHQSSLAAGNGARVARGQVIGYVGLDGLLHRAAPALRGASQRQPRRPARLPALTRPRLKPFAGPASMRR